MAAGWIGVLAGLFDTALPLLHPAPTAAIPFAVMLYGLLGVLLYALFRLIAAFAAKAVTQVTPDELALGSTTALFSGFFGLYFVTTSTQPWLAGGTGQLLALLAGSILSLALALLTVALSRGPIGRATIRRPSLFLLLITLFVYPALAGLYLLRDGAHDEDSDGPPRGFVLVSLDAMRGDRISALGYPRPTTPHIDELVVGGAAFSRALVPAPASAPGHACMLTGLPPLTHGVLANAHILGDEVLTVAERLKDEGFATAALVNNFYLESRFGFDQGFDLFIDRYQATQLDGFHPRHVLRATALFHAWARSFRVPGRRNDDTIEGAIAWLENRPQGDFFLFLHLMDPHSPYEPPLELADRFYTPEGEPVVDTEELRSRMPGRLTDTEVSALKDLYDAEVALGDQKVGRLVEALRRLNLLNCTLLVITADHGEVLYERDDIFDHGLAWDGNLHVPLVFHYPRGQSGTCRMQTRYRPPPWCRPPSPCWRYPTANSPNQLSMPPFWWPDKQCLQSHRCVR